MKKINKKLVILIIIFLILGIVFINYFKDPILEGLEKNNFVNNCKVAKNHVFKDQDKKYGHFVNPGNISFDDCKKKCDDDPKCNYFKSGPNQWCEKFYDDTLSNKTSWEDFYNKNLPEFKSKTGDVTYYTGLPNKYCYNNFSVYNKK